MSYFQAIVIALVQGVTELFPVSSLGHSVLVPAWIGGSWQTLVTQSSQATSETSFYLAFIVALHCATALALLWFFRADWVRIVRGFFRSLVPTVRAPRRVVHDADERLAPPPAARRPRRRRAARLAHRPRDDPRRHHLPGARARLPDRVRQAARRQCVPVRQRPDPARGRACASHRPRGRRGPRAAARRGGARHRRGPGGGRGRRR